MLSVDRPGEPLDRPPRARRRRDGTLTRRADVTQLGSGALDADAAGVRVTTREILGNSLLTFVLPQPEIAGAFQDVIGVAGTPGRGAWVVDSYVADATRQGPRLLRIAPEGNIVGYGWPFPGYTTGSSLAGGGADAPQSLHPPGR